MKRYLLVVVFAFNAILCFAQEMSITSYVFHAVTVIDVKSSSIKEEFDNRGMIQIIQYDDLKYILIALSPDRTQDLIFRVLQTNKERKEDYIFEANKCCAVDSIEGNNVLGSGMIMLEYNVSKNIIVPDKIWYQINGANVMLIYGGIIKVDA